MSSIINYTRASHHAMIRSLTPTSATARQILTKAGFDTPTSTPATMTKEGNGNGNGNINHILYAGMSTTSSVVSVSCPLSSTGGVGSSLPSLFASSNLCPCGRYTINAAPTECATAIRQQQQQMGQKIHTIKPSMVKLQARAFSTVATNATKTESAPTTTAASPTSSTAASPTPSSTTSNPPSASTSSSTPAPSTPQPPPGVTLNSAFSSAHASLLAIDDYRSGVQSLNKCQLVSARSMLERTRDIIAYVPHPSMGLFVKHLLATIAAKEGRFKDEKMIRLEMVKEIEKIWSKQFTAGGASPKYDDLVLASQILSSALLSFLRVDGRNEIIHLIESWLPRIESCLFGRPPSPVTSRTSPPPFGTGARHLRALALYTQLVQVGLFECATRTKAMQLKSQPIFQRSIAQLGSAIAAQPHLQSSNEWKEFQGELLLMPIAIEQIGGVADLLPANGRSAGTPLDRTLEAVKYFEQHTELQKRSLSETNMVRDWYSPLVQAYIRAAEIQFDQVDQPSSVNTNTPTSNAASSTSIPSSSSSPSGPSSPFRSRSDLLDACLAFVERSLTSDPSHPTLLRTLFPIALQAIEESEAIQAEGLLRNICARWEANMELHSSAPILDPTALTHYLNALFEYVHLLTKLEWNKVSRRNEGRSVLGQKFLPLLREVRVRNLIRALVHSTRRELQLEGNHRPNEITDQMLELNLNKQHQQMVPQWIIERLNVGTGTHG